MGLDQLSDRIDRARRREADLHVVSTDPVVYEIDSEHSGRTHTVVPDASYCSCEDARYRDVTCWHQLWIALNRSESGLSGVVSDSTTNHPDDDLFDQDGSDDAQNESIDSLTESILGNFSSR